MQVAALQPSTDQRGFLPRCSTIDAIPEVDAAARCTCCQRRTWPCPDRVRRGRCVPKSVARSDQRRTRLPRSSTRDETCPTNNACRDVSFNPGIHTQRAPFPPRRGRTARMSPPSGPFDSHGTLPLGPPVRPLTASRRSRSAPATSRPPRHTKRCDRALCPHSVRGEVPQAWGSTTAKRR